MCCCGSFWFWWEIGFGFTYLRTQSTIQLWRWVSFLVLAGNSFWCYIRTQCTIQLCSCVRFLVMAGNSSQNESTFLQQNIIGLLYYDPINRCVYFIRPNTLLLCIFLFCIFLLYCADPQVEVQIRILLEDKYRKSCQKCKHRQSHFDFLNNAYWVSLFQRNNLLAKICFS